VAIHGLVGRLLETCQERVGDEGQRLLRRLQTNAEHQERLLADLLALTRLEKKRATPKTVDTSVLLQEVIEEAQQEGPMGRVKVTIQSPLPVLYCDQRELLEVFRHLITNAIRFMGGRSDPQVQIAAADHGEWVEFSVQDNGIGIDPAYHERVFEIFQRLNEVETEGTGVGLAIVKKIIEGTGGKIWVESFKGQGSTFRFTWPKAEAEVS
jgi:signal transduction histidine kinase